MLNNYKTIQIQIAALVSFIDFDKVEPGPYSAFCRPGEIIFCHSICSELRVTCKILTTFPNMQKKMAIKNCTVTLEKIAARGTTGPLGPPPKWWSKMFNRSIIGDKKVSDLYLSMPQDQYKMPDPRFFSSCNS